MTAVASQTSNLNTEGQKVYQAGTIMRLVESWHEFAVKKSVGRCATANGAEVYGSQLVDNYWE